MTHLKSCAVCQMCIAYNSLRSYIICSKLSLKRRPGWGFRASPHVIRDPGSCFSLHHPMVCILGLSYGPRWLVKCQLFGPSHKPEGAGKAEAQKKLLLWLSRLPLTSQKSSTTHLHVFSGQDGVPQPWLAQGLLGDGGFYSGWRGA